MDETTTTPPPAAEGPPSAEHARRDRFLSGFSLALAEGRPLDELLSASAGEIGSLLDADRVGVFLFDGSPSSLRLRATWSRPDVPGIPSDLEPFRGRGVPAWLAEGRTLVTGDALSDPDPELLAERETARRLGTTSLVAVPVQVGGRSIGVVSAATVGRRRPFGSEDVAFLEASVRHLSAAVRQSGLVAALERERDRLALLVRLSGALQRSATEEDVGEAALLGLRETLGFPIGGVALLTPDRREVVVERAYGPRLGLLTPGARLPLGGDGPGRALARVVLGSGAPVVVDDITADRRGVPTRQLWEPLGVRTVVLLPLRVAGEPLGLMGAATSEGPRGVGPEDVATLQSLADLVSVALERQRAAAALRRSARESHALGEATHALLTRSAHRRAVLERILDSVVLGFGQEHARLLVVDRDGGRLVEAARHGDWRGTPVPVETPLEGGGAAAEAVRTAGPVLGRAPAGGQAEAGGAAASPDSPAELVVPLVADGVALGALELRSASPCPFGADDVRVLSAFAERAALALKLSGLVDALETRTRVLSSVARATQLLNFRMNAPDVLVAFVEEATRVFPGADGSVVYVASEDGRTLSIAAANGAGRATQAAYGTEPIPLAALRCAGTAFSENRIVFLDTEGLDALMSGASAEERARVRYALPEGDVGQLMAAPIRVGERRLGVIELLAGRPRAFTPADATTLSLLAEQSAIAIRNARMIEELQRSNRLKDDFLANLSHEVRTPLTGIVGWSEVLLDQKGSDPEVKRALTAVLGQAHSLNRMLADLIDLSRIENFGLELRRERVDAGALVATALEALGPSAARRQLRMESDLAPDLPHVDGDPERLRQVVTNLLSNAVKFSSPGGRVRVTARRDEEGQLTLSVEDDGFGIEPSFLPHVFERLRQEDTSTSRRHGGLGIGLAIARSIVAAHGGTIAAESPGRGKGSRFTVTLPADRLSSGSGTHRRIGLPKPPPARD